VRCWGRNREGQLGDGDVRSRGVPGEVVGLGGAAVAVSVGQDFTCVLMADGTVRCFGANTSGELGAGLLEARHRPVDAALGVQAARAIEGGFTHACAIDGSREVFCWGVNEQAQVGDGSTAPRPLPVPTGLPGATGLAAGERHSCAVTTTGSVYCWGAGDAGQLGLGPSRQSVPRPERLAGVTAATDIAAGALHTCAVIAGGAFCWGSNASGQLGNPTTSSSVPVAVSGLGSTVARVFAGGQHSCAVRSTGGARCWGHNQQGQLGHGAFSDAVRTPVDVSGLTTGVESLALGSAHTCALTTSGAVRCWGANEAGQLGDGTFESRSTPGGPVALGAPALALAAGHRHTCALLADATVACWGSPEAGAVGPIGSAQPVAIALPGPAVAIAAGLRFSCATLSTGRTLCWGASGFGQLGNGDGYRWTSPVTVAVAPLGVAMTVSSEPTPGVEGEPVTLRMRFDGTDIPLQGQVLVREGASMLCEVTILLRFEVQCPILLTPGRHLLAVEFPGDFHHHPASVLFEQEIVALAGQTCAGFDDLRSDDPLCREVQWVRNRNITLGCGPFNYCPGQAAGSLAMAAFISRAGGVLSPWVGTSSFHYPSLYSFGGQLCMLEPLAPADHPRRAQVDAVVSATASAPAEVRLRTGRFTFTLEEPGAEVTLSVIEGRYGVARVSGTFDIAAGDSPRFGIDLWSTTVAPTLEDVGCTIRVTLFERSERYAPYDPAAQ
jgi:alpha-tubulin suppressor-like RCC1 family protein